ncbi:MAG: hypothetical protein KKB37_13100 [Alphaproteobacteria bacterium]|nr:hypothetical protein [Alphaproteobacteria bacterium]
MEQSSKTFFTVVFPVAAFVVLFILEQIFSNITRSELGVVESAQAILLLLALAVAGSLLFQIDPVHPRWIKTWIVLSMLAILYVLLEEISYGKHYFNWNTPEYWKTLNDQEETNLHNTSAWLDQKPRTLLEIGIIIGGIIVPLLRRFKPEALPERLRPILPASALFVTALLAILPRIYERIMVRMDMHDWQMFARTSEIQEFYFFYFALLYFVFLKIRLTRSQQTYLDDPAKVEG